jgi:acyl dehydratase
VVTNGRGTAEHSTEWRGRFFEDFTLAVVLGLSVADTSENAAANVGWENIKLPKPVFAGDTLWAESEGMTVRESRSRPQVGFVGSEPAGSTSVAK